MAKKLEIINDPFHSAECAECLGRIVGQANGVFGSFEVASTEVFEDFHKKENLSLAETARKTVEFLEEQKLKHDMFLEEQKLKHKEFLDRADTRENIKIASNAIIMAIFATAIYFSYDSQRKMMLDIELMKIGKADKTEVVKKTEFELLIEQGDEWARNVFMEKTEINKDTFTYPINKKLVFKNLSRGSRMKN